MYILKNINDAVYYPLTVSDLAYFFMSKARKAKYITEEEYIQLKLEKEVEEKRAQIRAFRERGKQVEEERKKRLEIDAEARAWEQQRRSYLRVDPNMPDYSDNEYFNKKADQARETLEKHPFDHQHPLRDDHHHHRDHHNDHKASWGHDAGWNHGDSHKSDSTHDTHDSSSHSDSTDSGGYGD